MTTGLVIKLVTSAECWPGLQKYVAHFEILRLEVALHLGVDKRGNYFLCNRAYSHTHIPLSLLLWESQSSFLFICTGHAVFQR